MAPWQIGSWQKNPRGYKCSPMRSQKDEVDRSGIETVACVSSSPFLAHYPQGPEALQECYETVDYISLHHYHRGAGTHAALGGSVFLRLYQDWSAVRLLQTKLRPPSG